MNLHLWQKGTPLLEAKPPTQEELRWWLDAQKPFRRRAYLMGIPGGLACTLIPLALRDPSLLMAEPWRLLIGVPMAAVSCFLFGFFQWNAVEKSTFQSELAGKRIRERLLCADDEGAEEDTGTMERGVRP